MVDKKRLSVGLLVMTLAAAWAPGCSNSDGNAVNSAGSAGVAEAGAAEGGAGPDAAGASADGGTSDGGEPALSEAGSAGEAGSGGEAGASSEPDPRAPFAEWDATRANAQCTKDVACGKVYSVAGCAKALGTATYDAFYGGADYYGNQVDHYTLASASVRQKCLTEIAAAACGPGAPASCAKVLVPLAPSDKGASCRSTSPYLPQLPCGAGLECSRGTQCSVCIDETPPAELNGVCQYDDDCQQGLACIVSGNTATCQTPLALGEPCVLPSDCASGACVGTCKAYVLEGKACSGLAPCLPGLSCSAADNLCHPDPAPQPGEACLRHLGAAAESCNAWCVFAEPDAATGKCGAPVMKGPSPCARLAGSSVLGCPFGTFLDAAPATAADNISDSCTCQPRRAIGAPCTTFQQCLNGRCVAGANGSVCSKRLTAGETCAGAGDCEGSCNPETQKCDAVTSCEP